MTPDELVKMSWEELAELATDDTRALVYHVGDEPGKVLAALNGFLPPEQAFTCDEEEEGLSVRHHNGHFAISWREWEGIDRQIVELLSRLNRLLAPDYEIYAFQCTETADNGGFLVMPQRWWKECSGRFPEDFNRIFSDL